MGRDEKVRRQKTARLMRRTTTKARKADEMCIGIGRLWHEAKREGEKIEDQTNGESLDRTERDSEGREEENE